jgi:hypothetical protein
MAKLGAAWKKIAAEMPAGEAPGEIGEAVQHQ